ncbi:MAG: chloride channel protein [Deltaproteobacteria bacterium]|jgi:CIC family chloride channel protein
MAEQRRWMNLIVYLREHAISRWMFYSLLVGIVAGLGAAAFLFSLEWLKYYILDLLAGYPMDSPAGEHLVYGMPHGVLNNWILLLAPAVGGLISGLLVYTWAPEAEGHGTDAMIDAFHNKQGEIRSRVPYIKTVASVVTLATGGSAGREGPIVQIGAGFGSWLARLFKLDSREKRILLLAGCAGGLGAIFRAPLGGAITSIEVLYTEDFESEAIIPCVMSSVVAYSIFTFIFGHEPIFATPDLIFDDPRQLILYAVLGLVCVPVGWLYSKSLYGLRDHFFRRIPIKPHFIPALGGLVVGCLGLLTPRVLSGGYGTIQLALLGKLTISLMAVLVLTKIVATSCTIGSGGSGGVFGPSLFIGAMLGGIVGKLGHQYYPNLVGNPTAFALVGMAAFFAGVAKAPIGALLMVSEMTRGYGLVVPLMFVSAIPVLLAGRWGIYEKQVKNKFASPAHLADLTINALQNMQVRDVYNPQKAVTMLPMDMRLKEMKNLMIRTRESFFPVVDEEIRLVGILSFPDLRAILFEEALSELIVVGDLVEKPVAIGLNETLYEALIKFISSGYGQIPIIRDEHPGRLTGMLSLAELMEAYHQEMLRLEQG